MFKQTHAFGSRKKDKVKKTEYKVGKNQVKRQE